MPTIAQHYGSAMMITTKEEAKAYFEKLVQWQMTAWGGTREEAESIVRHNIGYYAGYYSEDIRAKVEELFECQHPVFGSVKTHGTPTPEEAFAQGEALGQHWKEQQEGGNSGTTNPI